MTKKIKNELQEVEKNNEITATNIKEWGGLFSDNKLNSKEFILKVAQIYGVPPSGVNLMAGQPYLNKEARLVLLHRYRKTKVMETKFLKVSEAPDQPAICAQTIIFEDDRYVDAIGEASKDSVSLKAVQATLNMMAETRALNRAIWKEIAGEVWEEAVKKYEGMELSDEEKEAVMNAGKVSAEELNYDEVAKESAKKNYEEALDYIEKNAPKMSKEEKDELKKKLNQSEKKFFPSDKKQLIDLLYAD